MASPTMKKLTPVLMVQAVEPCLAFWTALGFERTVEVPHGDRLGFVMLVKDGIEVMYQSRASVQADVPALAELPGGTALYLEVDDLDAVVAKLAGAPLLVPRRTSSYGADELAVREPGGNVVMFAQQAS